MDPQEPLLDELASGESTKQTNAMTRLISLAANGRDISIYFNHVVNHCMTPNDHKLKLLAYRVLKRCTLIDSEWEQKVVPHIARDTCNEDQNLAIAALELILHIPISSILVDFVGKVIFSPTFNHPAPAVRRASIETLSYLLLHKQGMLSSKSLVTSFWTSILGRLLDDASPIVFQVAFRAVSNLFEAVDNLSPMDNIDSFGDGFYKTRAHQLQRTVMEVKTQLIPHFDLLLKRVDFLELPFRAPAVNVLTCLVIEIPKDPILQAKVAPTLYPAIAIGGLVSNFVESYLLPFLTHADDGLAFACGKAILRIWETKESHRRDWAISATLALVGILRRETIAISPSTVITEILKVMHLIPETQLIPCTLKLLTSIAEFTESQQRRTSLSQVFTLLIVKDLKRGEGEGGIVRAERQNTIDKSEGEKSEESQPRRVHITQEHVFLDLFKDKWLIDVWTTEAPFREELLLAMVMEYSKFKSRYLDTKSKNGLTDRERFSYLFSSMKFIQLCNDTLMWHTADRSHAVEQYVRFIDWQLEHVKYLPKTEDYDPIWQLQTQRVQKLAIPDKLPSTASVLHIRPPLPSFLNHHSSPSPPSFSHPSHPLPHASSLPSSLTTSLPSSPPSNFQLSPSPRSNFQTPSSPPASNSQIPSPRPSHSQQNNSSLSPPSPLSPLSPSTRPRCGYTPFPRVDRRGDFVIFV